VQIVIIAAVCVVASALGAITGRTSLVTVPTMLVGWSRFAVVQRSARQVVDGRSRRKFACTPWYADVADSASSPELAVYVGGAAAFTCRIVCAVGSSCSRP
jgi:hypothetical protein